MLILSTEQKNKNKNHYEAPSRLTPASFWEKETSWIATYTTLSSYLKVFKMKSGRNFVSIAVVVPRLCSLKKWACMQGMSELKYTVNK